MAALEHRGRTLGRCSNLAFPPTYLSVAPAKHRGLAAPRFKRPTPTSFKSACNTSRDKTSGGGRTSVEQLERPAARRLHTDAMKPWRLRDEARQEFKSGGRGKATKRHSPIPSGGTNPGPETIPSRRTRATPTDDATEAEHSGTKQATLFYRLRRANTESAVGVQPAGIPVDALPAIDETSSAPRKRRKSASAATGATPARTTQGNDYREASEDGTFKIRGGCRHTSSNCRDARKRRSSSSRYGKRDVSSST
ncbi:hypothetical protein HPB51_021269 [Rhipicephalus microplus]|uniref:Uncharacterized protein n=1 Tax=Rhipicephalus microplus TaxID=6941 RepID=A0A9J6F7H2_RHIMP|nr:hypothetical protein HPB51_021269 [Rhipicephalus microplus]